jgi:hypothetical protein
MLLSRTLTAAILIGAATCASAQTCTYGSEETVTACHRLSTLATWEGREENSATCVWNPLPGWGIVQHEVVVLNTNNGTVEVNTLAGGSRFASELQLQQAYDLAGRLAVQGTNPQTGQDQSFRGEWESRGRQHLQELRRFEASHNTLQVIVRAWAHGNRYTDRRRGWQEVSVRVRTRCIAPPPTNQQAMLAAVLSTAGIETRGIRIQNDCSDEVAVHIRFQNIGGAWGILGPYRVQPNTRTPSLVDSTGAPVRLRGDEMYYHATARGRTWGTGATFPLPGTDRQVRWNRVVAQYPAGSGVVFRPHLTC